VRVSFLELVPNRCMAVHRCVQQYCFHRHNSLRLPGVRYSSSRLKLGPRKGCNCKCWSIHVLFHLLRCSSTVPLHRSAADKNSSHVLDQQGCKLNRSPVFSHRRGVHALSIWPLDTLHDCSRVLRYSSLAIALAGV
jgi:hypothetical protein